MLAVASFHAHTVANGFDAGSPTHRPKPGASHSIRVEASNLYSQLHAYKSIAGVNDDSLMLTLQLTLINWTAHCASSTVSVTLRGSGHLQP
jgi:hypothetical protein